MNLYDIELVEPHVFPIQRNKTKLEQDGTIKIIQSTYEPHVAHTYYENKLNSAHKKCLLDFQANQMILYFR